MILSNAWLIFSVVTSTVEESWFDMFVFPQRFQTLAKIRICTKDLLWHAVVKEALCLILFSKRLSSHQWKAILLKKSLETILEVCSLSFDCSFGRTLPRTLTCLEGNSSTWLFLFDEAEIIEKKRLLSTSQWYYDKALWLPNPQVINQMTEIFVLLKTGWTSGWETLVWKHKLKIERSSSSFLWDSSLT